MRLFTVEYDGKDGYPTTRYLVAEDEMTCISLLHRHVLAKRKRDLLVRTIKLVSMEVLVQGENE